MPTQNYLVKSVSGRVTQIDYNTSSSAVNAGDVVVIGGVAYFSESDIPANSLGALSFSGGNWAGAKASGGWTLGAPVYFDTAATPNTVPSDSAAGAFTQASTATATFVGYCVATPNTTAAALTADQYGYFVKTVQVIGGSGSGQAQTVAAAGTNQATAAQLGPGFNFVTGAAGSGANVSVLLPVGVAGQTVDVKNADAANAILPVYPAASGTINALSSSAAYNLAAKTSISFKCLSPGVWYTIPLLGS